MNKNKNNNKNKNINMCYFVYKRQRNVDFEFSLHKCKFGDVHFLKRKFYKGELNQFFDFQSLFEWYKQNIVPIHYRTEFRLSDAELKKLIDFYDAYKDLL
jgi:hypothetical protein